MKVVYYIGLYREKNHSPVMKKKSKLIFKDNKNFLFIILNYLKQVTSQSCKIVPPFHPLIK